MSWFTFNNYNSSNDLIITQPIIRPSWAQEMNEISTNKVSHIIQLSRSYSSTPLTVHAVIENTSVESIRRLYSSLQGFGKLVLSSNPDEYMYAVASVLQPETVAMTMAELDIMFTLLPFAYAVSTTIKDISSANYTKVINNGTVFSAPEIRFTPTSAGNVIIDVNSALFSVKVPENLVNREIIIDCDIEETYYVENGNKISINNLTYYNYPLLHTGDNYVKISENAVNSTVNVRARWF